CPSWLQAPRARCSRGSPHTCATMLCSSWGSVWIVGIPSLSSTRRRVLPAWSWSTALRPGICVLGTTMHPSPLRCYADANQLRSLCNRRSRRGVRASNGRPPSPYPPRPPGRAGEPNWERSADAEGTSAWRPNRRSGIHNRLMIGMRPGGSVAKQDLGSASQGVEVLVGCGKTGTHGVERDVARSGSSPSLRLVSQILPVAVPEQPALHAQDCGVTPCRRRSSGDNSHRCRQLRPWLHLREPTVGQAAHPAVGRSGGAPEPQRDWPLD